MKFLQLLILTGVVATLGTPCLGVGNRFHIDPAKGNDSNDGMSPSSAWQTTSRVERQTYGMGDSILFLGGTTIKGGFEIQCSGASRDPIVISSYGKGRATIDAGPGHGIHWKNASHGVIRNLDITTSARHNTGNGIFLENNAADRVQTAFVIEDVVCHGFGMALSGRGGSTGSGIRVTARNPGGLKDLTIRHCTFHHNEFCGMNIQKVVDFKIVDCDASENQGNPAYKKNWTGSGIQIERCANGLIERCTANGNGASNGCAWGPVGIILVASSHLVVQYCTAMDNKDPHMADGGGIDIDSGDGCVVQYCFTRNNIGPGFYINPAGEGRTAQARNCVFRYNVSENDGGPSGSYGAFLAEATSGCLIENTLVYNNTFYKNTKGAVVKVAALKNSNLWFYNNICFAEGEAHLLDHHGHDKSLRYLNNNWFSTADFHINYEGTSYGSLKSWRATGQEADGGIDYGFSTAPRLLAPGKGRWFPFMDQMSNLREYQFDSSSPCLDTGLDIRSALKIEVGGNDYYGNPIPRQEKFDVGAFEYRGFVYPSVQLTSPAADKNVEVGDAVALVSVTGKQDGVVKVDFRCDSTLLETVSVGAAGWTTSWAPREVGTYQLTAIATNPRKLSTVSQKVMVAVGQKGNLIANPGFESGQVGWSGSGSLASDQAHTGANSLALTNQSSFERIQQDLRPNTTYRLSAWGKLSDLGNRASLFVKDHGDAEQKVEFTSTRWECKELYFTTGSDRTSCVLGVAQSGVGYNWFDDFFLKQ